MVLHFLEILGNLGNPRIPQKFYGNLWKSQKIDENPIKNRKSFENQENWILIKHFIKELIRKIGPAFLEIQENLGNLRIPMKFYGNLWKSQEINENPMKNRKSFENPENCTLIKHFIKELIRRIGPAFSGNPRKSRTSEDS